MNKPSGARRRGNDDYWKSVPITNNPYGDGGSGREWNEGWIEGSRKKINYGDQERSVLEEGRKCANCQHFDRTVGAETGACFGAPPRVFWVDGARQQERPLVMAGEKACGLHLRRVGRPAKTEKS